MTWQPRKHPVVLSTGQSRIACEVVGSLVDSILGTPPLGMDFEDRRRFRRKIRVMAMMIFEADVNAHVYQFDKRYER